MPRLFTALEARRCVQPARIQLLLLSARWR